MVVSMGKIKFGFKTFFFHYSIRTPSTVEASPFIRKQVKLKIRPLPHLDCNFFPKLARPGVDFTNVLCPAFMRVDPKYANRLMS